MHVSLVPVLGSGEQKSKPTQHSVRALMASGIQPDLVLCRCRDPIDEALRRKLAMFCQVDDGNMLTVADVSNIYHVPLLLHNQGAASRIGSLVRAAESATPMVVRCSRVRLCGQLGMDIDPAPGVEAWKHLATAVDTAVDEVHIALVGKYTGLQDSYLSVLKALKHSAVACNRRLVVDWVEAETLEAGRGEGGTEECVGLQPAVRSRVPRLAHSLRCVAVTTGPRPHGRCWRVRMACLFQADSAPEAPTARSLPSSTLAHPASRSWGCAWACSAW